MNLLCKIKLCLYSLQTRVDLSAPGFSFSWKNRLEELELSHTTSVCVCVDCIYASVCVTVYERAYLQPCIFVSSPHSVHVLQLVAVVTAADMWPAGCVLCMGGMRVAFLSHTDSSLSPSPFCRQCFMSTNRPARKLVTEELEGRETDWKVTQPAGNICVCVFDY